MPSLYATLFRPWLFRCDPEIVHQWAVEASRLAGRIPGFPDLIRAALVRQNSHLATSVAGLRFSNPIGLAAGWDKNGLAVRFLDHLGFGHLEIGSISAQPSSGNPGRRLFRLPLDRALVVNYGVPNEGADRVAHRLAGYRSQVPLGVSLVATNRGDDHPATEEEIFDDYATSLSALQAHADFLTLNLSCPNARDGRDVFASRGAIARLLQRLEPLGVAKPVFLKVAPDPNPAAWERLVWEVDSFPFVRGFQFNLPSGKPETLALTTARSVWEQMPGAVSGPPVAALIDRCVAGLFPLLNRPRHSIIAAGGITSAEDAYRKIRLGASLVQIYTALIYEGPGLIGRIQQGLAQMLQRDGFTRLEEAVGVDSIAN